MNYLFITQAELVDVKEKSEDRRFNAILSNERAQEALGDHDLKPGLTISCVIENTGRGKVEISKCSPEKIELVAYIDEGLPARMPVDLVVAYSRPQTLKKLFHLASSLGLRSLSFVKTANVVPSYLQSKSLEPKEIRRHFVLGCEQAGDGIFPQFHEFGNFYELIKNPLVSSFRGPKLYGDISPVKDIRAVEKEALLLLGPESGFTVDEKNALSVAGFSACSLGPRVLRVEVAASLLLGALSVKSG